MPTLEYQTKLQLLKNIKAFLFVKAGVSRDPDIGEDASDLQLEVRQADRRELQTRLEAFRTQIAVQRERIERLQASLEVIDAGMKKGHRGKQPRDSNKPSRIVILDDVFPHLLSGFRIAEYNTYLDRWPSSTVYTTANYRILRDKRNLEQVREAYEQTYPSLSRRVYPFDGAADLTGSLVYTMFVNNADFFLNAIHAHDVPFVFTLYPGGGLQLREEASDEKLRRICASPNLAKIIVTQKVVKDYLLDGSFCDEDKIAFIYGGVYQASFLTSKALPKSAYKRDKDTFDVCFVAHKYMERGIDKGYDAFIEVAKLLSKSHEDVRIHVVGSFDSSDIDVAELGDKITFYGTKESSFFPDFYSGMDAIISPNVPFVLAPGAFDIFPIGCCIEAGACGVPVFCTDPLNQNVAFEDGEEIVILEKDALSIARKLDWYHDHPNELIRLSEQGKEAFQGVFNREAQMAPRIELLEQLTTANTQASSAQ